MFPAPQSRHATPYTTFAPANIACGWRLRDDERSGQDATDIIGICFIPRLPSQPVICAAQRDTPTCCWTRPGPTNMGQRRIGSAIAANRANKLLCSSVRWVARDAVGWRSRIIADSLLWWVPAAWTCHPQCNGLLRVVTSSYQRRRRLTCRQLAALSNSRTMHPHLHLQPGDYCLRMALCGTGEYSSRRLSPVFSGR